MEIDNNTRNTNVVSLSSLVDKKKAKEIETSIYNFSVEYAETNNSPYLLESIYDNKFEEIICQLKNNNYILDNIKNNTIDCTKIAFLKPEEINPEKYEKIIKKRELEEYKKNNVIGSDAFTCVKCKQSKCKVTQKQTRAGDEPPTTFVECLNCGHIFKF
jgi:DNA-directed RNA polymerase subunit M/transcription elongation factor TFIIS